jgi:hypothetical protein
MCVGSCVLKTCVTGVYETRGYVNANEPPPKRKVSVCVCAVRDVCVQRVYIELVCATCA